MITPEQQAAIDAVAEHGSYQAAANTLGTTHASIKGLVRRGRKWLDAPEGQKSAIEAAGLNLSTAKHGWRVIQHEDGSRDSVFWKSESAPEEYIDLIRDAFMDLTPAPAIKAPALVMDNLCTVYPVMDLHYGMQAWGQETGGADYGLKEADADVEYAFEKVMAITPQSDTAILLLPGDTLHADDNRAETPQSKHKLDVDTRHWKVLDCGVALVDYMIQRLLTRHRRVVVRIMRGNHDEHSHLVLSFAIAERFRHNDRVEIEKQPRDLFMRQWGTSAIFAHHGDKAKPQQLALYLSDVCPFWSDTRHRYALTGHVHHDQAKDVGPLRWESLRAFCPPDSYAASMGYGARRALQSLTFDRADGLVLRAIDPISRTK